MERLVCPTDFILSEITERISCWIYVPKFASANFVISYVGLLYCLPDVDLDMELNVFLKNSPCYKLRSSFYPGEEKEENLCFLRNVGNFYEVMKRHNPKDGILPLLEVGIKTYNSVFEPRWWWWWWWWQ